MTERGRRGLLLLALCFASGWFLDASCNVPPVLIPPGPVCTLDTRTCNCWKWEANGTGRGWFWVECVPSPSPTVSPSPTPSPPPTPLPTPLPTPAPTPEPTPTPPLGCGLPPGTGDGLACPKDSPQYGEDVAAAQSEAITREEGVRGDRITDSKRYHAAIVYHLIERGFCAYFDGEEVAVKKHNTFNEQWDMERANGTVLRSYQGTCRPAWSAIPAAGLPPSPGPTPAPTPCPEPTPFQCPPNTPQCWDTCKNRLDWDVARGNLTPLPGSTLLYNDPGNDPSHREYFDRKCNKVDRQGNILHGPEWFGTPCEHAGAICPPPKAAPCPSPTPTPGPTPQPGPTPAECPSMDCIEVTLHACQDAQHHTTPGPVAGGSCYLDATPHFGGPCLSRYRCNAEQCNPQHDFCACGGRDCEDPSGYCWVYVSGPPIWWNPENPGAGRGYGVAVGHAEDPLKPGTYCFKAYGGHDCPMFDGEGKRVAGEGQGERCFTVP